MQRLYKMRLWLSFWVNRCGYWVSSSCAEPPSVCVVQLHCSRDPEPQWHTALSCSPRPFNRFSAGFCRLSKKHTRLREIYLKELQVHGCAQTSVWLVSAWTQQHDSFYCRFCAPIWNKRMWGRLFVLSANISDTKWVEKMNAMSGNIHLLKQNLSNVSPEDYASSL